MTIKKPESIRKSKFATLHLGSPFRATMSGSLIRDSSVFFDCFCYCVFSVVTLKVLMLLITLVQDTSRDRC